MTSVRDCQYPNVVWYQKILIFCNDIYAKAKSDWAGGLIHVQNCPATKSEVYPVNVMV